MKRFAYRAVAPSGRILEGEVAAETLPLALSILKLKGIDPFHAEESRRGLETAKRRLPFLASTGLGFEHRARIVRQLATLLAAGIALDRSLRIVAGQQKAGTVRRIVEDTTARVAAGAALSDALAHAAPQFGSDETGIIRAGEQNGSLASVLDELAGMLERRLELRGKLVSALVYPAFLLVMAPLTLVIVATILVPRIAPLFEDTGAPMPLVLRGMIWLATEFEHRGVFWLAAIAGAVLASIAALRHERGRAIAERLRPAIPILERLRKRTESARLCRTLGSLLRSGTPLPSALASLAEASGNALSRRGLLTVRDDVNKGIKLSRALGHVPAFDDATLQMIAVGEETNRLEAMLLHVAASHETELARAIERTMALLTPLLTVALGLLVGGIVLSIMQAVLAVNEIAVR